MTETLVETVQNRKTAWTLKELAILMNCSKGKLYALVDSNRIPYFRLGSMIRFDPKTTAQWMSSKMIEV